MRMRIGLAGLLLLLPAATPAQERDTWTWDGTVARGQALEIKGVNGSIEARLASGSQVKVTANKTARSDAVSDVRLEVVEHAGGVTICAVYPTPRGRRPNECEPGEGGRSSVRNNDVKVHFVVELPRTVEFVGRTVNGDVIATGLESDVRVHTVNGDVRIATAGLASAETVNGTIDVTMGRSDWQDRLEFETVNGRVTVAFSGELNAEVTASTVNGGINTDYPLTVRGRFGPQRMSGTIGSGGRQLSLATVNGSIEILRR